MRKLYRVYFDGCEGESTEGYIELSEGEYNVLYATNKALHGVHQFELEEVVTNIKFEDYLKKKQEELEIDRKNEEEKEKDSVYVTIRDKAVDRFNKAMEKLDKEYDEKGKGTLEYMAKRMGIFSGFNEDILMAEMSYASHKMFNNFTGIRKDE